jgi:anti-sigma regulatory factor (Ser/Thr protein kinase)
VREISLHVMDIVENGVAAGAKEVQISVVEDTKKNRLRIAVKDDGRGIPEHRLDQVLDPFYTTKTARRVGLGLSLFREAARRCDGEFELHSKEGEGTEVIASFRLDHLDLAPLGDMASSMTSLIMGNPEVDFVYTHERNGRSFQVDTRELRKELEGIPITHPEVLKTIGHSIRESLEEIMREERHAKAND